MMSSLKSSSAEYSSSSSAGCRRWTSSTKSTCRVAQVGEDRGQVALDLQRWPAGLLKGTLQFVGDDVGQRRFAQPGRAVEQNMVERLAA